MVYRSKRDKTARRSALMEFAYLADFPSPYKFNLYHKQKGLFTVNINNNGELVYSEELAAIFEQCPKKPLIVKTSRGVFIAPRSGVKAWLKHLVKRGQLHERVITNGGELMWATGEKLLREWIENS